MRKFWIFVLGFFCIAAGPIGWIAFIILYNKKLKYRTPKTVKKNKNCKLIDCSDLFDCTLENTLDFIEVFIACNPKEWLILNISPAYEKTCDCSADGYSCYEYYIEIEITVGNWYDGILYTNKKAKDYITSIYKYDPSDNTFTYRILMAESTDCVLKTEATTKKLFECLDDFEKKHPNRKLERTSYGVHQTWIL